MNIDPKLEGRMITVQYELTEKELDILQFVAKNGYIEFRRRMCEEDRTDNSGKFRESECRELLESGFLDYDDDAYHMTFLLTPLSESVLLSKE